MLLVVIYALGFISLPGLMNSSPPGRMVGVGNVSAYLDRRSLCYWCFCAWFHRCWLLVPLAPLSVVYYY